MNDMGVSRERFPMTRAANYFVGEENPGRYLAGEREPILAASAELVVWPCRKRPFADKIS
jgi:hypothetical protein